jgi:hypothetical protein
MAFAVEVIKVKEENDWVYYHYRSARRDVRFGKIKIAKPTGDVFLLENAESDESGAQAKRAGWRLMQHWKKGEYPEKTYWES